MSSRPAHRVAVLLLSLAVLPACTRARLEFDKTSGAEFPTDEYYPPGAGGGNFQNIPRVFTQGGRNVVVDLDDENIPELDPAGTCITNDELENLILTYRNSGTSPSMYSCFGGWTCTDHPVYGVVVNHKYGGSTGVCQPSKVGLMGDVANRGVFIIFYANLQIIFSDKNLFKAALHELGHTFNLHHGDALGGSIMTTPVTSQDDTPFFSNTSETHLQDHPEDKMWPNSGAFDDFTMAHGNSHTAQAPADPGRVLELSIALEPPAPYLGESVRAVVKLYNRGSSSVPIPDDLTPEAGMLRIEITGPDGTISRYEPMVFVDSLAEPDMLPAGGERSQGFPIFFGARGWTFDRPGTYSLRASLSDGAEASGSSPVSEPATLVVLDDEGAARALLEAGEASFEAGKFLTWLGGDHLHAGISLLKDLVFDYPSSPLADQARVALGVSASRDVRSFTLGKVRRAECWTALHYLDAVDAERLPADLHIRKNLAQARCLLGTAQADRARDLIDEAAAVAAERGDLGRLFEGVAALNALR